MAQKTTLKEFESVYPKLEEAILDHARSYKLPQGELDWLTKVSCVNEVDNNTVAQIANFCLFITLEPRNQPSRWQMQPWNVCPRLRLYPPRPAPHRRAILQRCYPGMDD